MNIEEKIDIVKDFCNIKILYGRELCLLEEQLISYQSAIESLLTAYEKEKGENVKLRLQDIPLIEGELKAYKDRSNELKQELEKEKEKNKELTDEYLVQRDLINPDFLKDYIHKDKIKAKIEEINKEMLNEENSLELFYRKKYCKEVLQSLLEKE